MRSWSLIWCCRDLISPRRCSVSARTDYCDRPIAPLLLPYSAGRERLARSLCGCCWKGASRCPYNLIVRPVAPLARDISHGRSCLYTPALAAWTGAAAGMVEVYVSAAHGIQATGVEARLNMLLVMCSALLVSQDAEAVPRLIVHEGMRLFPGAIGALLALVDPASGDLQLCACTPHPLTDLLIRPGQGVEGRAFLAPRAMLLMGPELDLALENLDAGQLVQLRQLLDPWPPSSAFAAPLRIEHQRLGALVVYGGARAHLFHPRDLPFVQGVADLAAVAI